MDLGALDRKVAFQRQAFTTNARNEKVPSGWATIAEVMAGKAPVSDGEQNDGAQVKRLVTDRFKTHWSQTLEDLDLTETLLCRGVRYDLIGRKELGRREGFEWSATARPGLRP